MTVRLSNGQVLVPCNAPPNPIGIPFKLKALTVGTERWVQDAFESGGNVYLRFVNMKTGDVRWRKLLDPTAENRNSHEYRC